MSQFGCSPQQAIAVEGITPVAECNLKIICFSASACIVGPHTLDVNGTGAIEGSMTVTVTFFGETINLASLSCAGTFHCEATDEQALVFPFSSTIDVRCAVTGIAAFVSGTCSLSMSDF